MKKILLAGAGSLGSRHLQALAKAEMPIAITVLDPFENALRISKERFEEMPKNNHIVSVNYISEIEQLSDDYSLLINATTADIRYEVTKSILTKCDVNNIVFEKVLFQDTEDYIKMSSILKEREINAWVNCPRRMYPYYQKIQHLFKDKEICFVVQGGEWGLACNGIHFIDLFAYFTNSLSYSFDINGLDNTIQPSKRKGFIEFTGTMRAFDSLGNEIVLISVPNSTAPPVITITSDDFMVHIDEMNGKAVFSSEHKNWNWEFDTFKVPYQSEMSHVFMQEILGSDNCKLTEFKISAILHGEYLRSLLQKMSQIKGSTISICPIT